MAIEMKNPRIEMTLNGKLVAGFDADLHFDFTPDGLIRDTRLPDDYLENIRKFREPRHGVSGSFAAEISFVVKEKNFFPIPAAPPLRVRLRDDRVEVCAGAPVKLAFAQATGRLKPLEGEMWSEVGSVRSTHLDNRLRKFVKRGGRLVEVRARGRTGERSLEEAVRACGVAGCGGSTFTIEGKVEGG